jgi:thiol:disulfide interchange protein
MKKVFFYIVALSIVGTFGSCNGSKGSTASTPKKPKTEKPTEETPVEETEKPVKALVNFINSDDVDSALKLAQKQNKTLFIDFYTSWCAPCKIMEQSVFRDVLVADYMNENCISIRVNAEKGNGPNMKIAYVVDAYPTMLFYSPKGDEVARKAGSMGIEEFKKFMKAAVWKAKSTEP